MLPHDMKRLSICQFSSYRWSFFEDIVRYSNHGFNSIGVWRRKIDDFGAEAAADLLHEMKMSVSSLHWAGGFTGDGQSFSDAIEDAIESIQLASRFNANCLILHPGSRNGHTTSHANRLFDSALSKLLPIAEDYGVKLAIEPVQEQPCSPWTFFSSFQESLEVLERFPSLGLVLDLYHIGFDASVYEFLDEFIDRVELVQLADRKLTIEEFVTSRRGESFRLPLGKGEVPIEAWLSKLHRLGYNGFFELEVHGSLTPRKDYHGTLEQTANYFSQPKLNSLIKPIEKVEFDRRFQLKNNDQI